MAYSITLTVDAFGAVSISAKDCLGGGSYPIGSKHGGDLEGLDSDAAVECMTSKLNLDHLKAAVGALTMCLPPPEVFDETGRPQ